MSTLKTSSNLRKNFMKGTGTNMIIFNYPSKKACKAAIGEPLKYIETSAFGPEYVANGSMGGANRPHITQQGREWFGEVTMEAGLIKSVK